MKTNARLITPLFLYFFSAGPPATLGGRGRRPSHTHTFTHYR